MSAPGAELVDQVTASETYAEFVRTHERKLRQALVAACGDAGRDATAEALEYGWRHWDRVREMENPVGYLFVVGRSKGRRRRKRLPLFAPIDTNRTPEIEPKLTAALEALSERQRVAVVLVHCFQWTETEIADELGIGRSSVQTHLERGMASLRRAIGDVHDA